MAEDQDKKLFRKVALDRLSSPEQLDRLMQVTNPRSWLALLAMGIIIGASIAWGIFGNIETTVEGQGLLGIATGAIEEIPFRAPQNGRLQGLQLREAQFVGEGQFLGNLILPDGNTVPLLSPSTGIISNVTVAEGDPVQAGQTLFLLLRFPEQGNQQLEAVIYVSVLDAEEVRPGMDVRLNPVTLPAQEFGYLEAVVRTVGQFPATDEIAESLAREDEVVIEVRLDLVKDADSPTGYEWTIGEGPDELPRIGTLTRATIIVQEERPIARVFPILE